jgi:hypothetical protein
MAPLNSLSAVRQVSPSEEKRDDSNQLILAACREIRADEKQVLSKHFKKIIYYDPQLHQGKMILKDLAFDLLIVDATNPLNHTFLEVTSAQAKEMGVRVVVLKRSMTNSKDLADALGASVISSIEECEDLSLFMTKCKLPKVVGRIKYLIKKVFGLFSSC